MEKFIPNLQNKTNLSAFLAASLRELGQAMLKEGEELVIGGSFTDRDPTVSLCQLSMQ